MSTNLIRRNYSFAISLLFLYILVLSLPFLVSCSEDQNPITDDHDHEEVETLHADADGVLLKVDGVEVYRQFQDSQSGEITLAEGEEIDVQVIFLNSDEEELHLDEITGEGDNEHEHEDEETFTLAIAEYDTSIIEVHLSEDDEEHGHTEDEHTEEDSEMSFEVIGLQSGKTTIKLQLLHGDHPDFTALPIPVTVP